MPEEQAYLVTEAKRRAIDEYAARQTALLLSYRKALDASNQLVRSYVKHIEEQDKRIIELCDEIRLLLANQFEKGEIWLSK